MKSPISIKFSEGSSKRKRVEDVESFEKFREIHFIKDPVSTRRSPLERLTSLKDLICNGLNSSTAVKLFFSTELKSIKFAKKIQFPSKTVNESLRFGLIIRVITILIENLNKKLIVTRRDIYYQDVELFQSQENVDSIIYLICSSLGFEDHEIGAVAAQKGLYYGDLTLILNDNVSQHFENIGIQLIPRLIDVKAIKIPKHVEYGLIIEKDAVLNTLVHSKSIENNCLLITGKGYPDKLTKQFVSMIHKYNPNLILIAFNDLDPHGLNIMKQYKTGGNSKFSCQDLIIGEVSIFDFINTSNCLNLSIRDFNLCLNWLSNESLFNNTEGRIELQRMMFFGKKAELDGIKLNKNSIDVVEYVNIIINRVIQNKKKISTSDQ